MNAKTLPLTPEQLDDIVARYPTPFHIYDEAAMRANAKALAEAFSWVPGGFCNHFAVKALPNSAILRILKEEGMGADCSSMAELVLASRAGFRGADIMFTSNDTPDAEFAEAARLGAIVNLDDIGHIGCLERASGGLPELVCCRYNPGSLKRGNDIIGKPEEAKYGFTREQLFEGFATLKSRGVKKFGLHAMVASNELDADYFVETASILFSLAAELRAALGIHFDFINLGGGIGIPYRPEQDRVDIGRVSAGIREAYGRLLATGHPAVAIRMESGRMIAGPYGWLVTRVLHVKRTYRTFVGLDACMANLMRPALYGAYHHISVPGKRLAGDPGPGAPVKPMLCDLTGSLCENNDKFAIDRVIPEVVTGDLVVIHDSGAHGHSMGFNYNGKLRSAELLLRPDGSVKLIRRAETLDDLFATLEV